MCVQSVLPGRKYCSKACSSSDPNRFSNEGRERIRLAKLGENNPAKRDEVRAKIVAALEGKARRGQAHPLYKGFSTDKKGRVTILLPTEKALRHPTASKKGYILRSHLVWDIVHPDDLVRKGEIIHHEDRDPSNDRPANFRKLTTNSEHATIHQEDRIWRVRPACEVCGAPCGLRRRFCSIRCVGISQQGEGNPHFGGTHTQEARESIRQARTGTEASPETRQKMAESQRKRWMDRRK